MPDAERRADSRGAGGACAVAIAFALLLGPSGASRAAVPAKSAREVVSNALDQVIAILNDSALAEETRRDRIAEIAYQHFDFSTMSKLVIARPWRDFTPKQRTEFIEAFKTHLSRSYGRRLGRYDGTQVEVVSEVTEPRGDITVHTRVVGGQFDGAEMNYRMRGTSGEWLVIDVIIEGVSLVSNFRSQFKPILAQGGAAELLRRLEDKNDALQAEIEVEKAAVDSGQPVSSTASDDSWPRIR